jgi:hypothetical protein
VRERLSSDPQPLAALGWLFDFTSAGISVWRPDGAAEAARGVSVSLRSGGRQMVIDFPYEEGTPEERAEAIIETLVRGDPAGWAVAFKGGSVAEWPHDERDELGPGGGTRTFRG